HIHNGRLHMQWTHDNNTHTTHTIQHLAENTLDALRQLAALADRPATLGYTPSDLPLSGLTQEELDTLVEQLRRLPAWRASKEARPLEDCYPQTPIQQGLWFQSQFAQGEGVYHVQMVHGIELDLDVDAFRRSWAEVMRRHPILRTSFRQEADEALQLVWADVPVPLEEQDWRSGTPEQQREWVEAYLGKDRAQGFASEDVPQWRLLLARTGDAQYRLVWSAHHTVLDGWSLSLILGDVVRGYEALTGSGQPLTARIRPYRDYVTWLKRQDMGEAEEYWRTTLQGVEQATPLSVERHVAPGSPSPGAGEQGELGTDFSEEDTRRLHELCQAHHLTLNTVLQGCWALLLSRNSGTDDVVFGTVTSGRPLEVEGVERMVGLFINTLPLRVGVPEGSSVLDWLHGLQEQNVQMRQYEYSPLGQVQRWSGLPSGAPLFESLFVFENYPVERDEGAALRFELLRSEERINYALGAVATVPDRIHLDVQYDRGRFADEAVQRLLRQFTGICAQVSRDPRARLSEITVLTEEERRQILGQSNAAAPQDVGEDFDLLAFAAEAEHSEDRALLEQLLAEVQGASPDDGPPQTPTSAPTTETGDPS
ncbi:condensation domain-containing protein, partial [Streptomyces diacarni]|uniref:condensation domain-containing protein n=1 Tax=Streptomyces diacarni TaxID=2800381 RepID=UPI003408F962